MTYTLHVTRYTSQTMPTPKPTQTSAQKALETYRNSIEAKTGQKIESVIAQTKAKNFAKVGEAVAWLKAEYGLGHGHASYVAQRAINDDKFSAPAEDKLADHFAGDKAKWRKPYDKMAKEVAKFGDDVKLSPNRTYINLQRGEKKFGIVQISSAERMDIGIKLKGAGPIGRVEAAGAWNAMVTHRIRIADPKEINAEVFVWLRQAYEKA